MSIMFGFDGFSLAQAVEVAETQDLQLLSTLGGSRLFSRVPFLTAGLQPELFKSAITTALSRRVLIVVLSVFMIAGFAFRVHNLASEGLSEDELNKLNAVSDYRAHGLTSANGEHPLLMKALLTVSVIAAEKWNQTSLVTGHPDLNLPVETSLRIPGALFGSLIAVLIF